MASRLRGVAKTRRLLKRMPDAVQQEVLNALNATGRELAAGMQARAPVRTGALRAALSYKVFPKTLRMQVGILGPKGARSKLFYARILEFGRKAQTVTITRGPRAGASMRVSPLTARRFVTRGNTVLRDTLTKNLKNMWEAALGRVAEGGGYE
jgi:hypothetical protein